jgi:hypothetical protein
MYEHPYMRLPLSPTTHRLFQQIHQRYRRDPERTAIQMRLPMVYANPLSGYVLPTTMFYPHPIDDPSTWYAYTTHTRTCAVADYDTMLMTYVTLRTAFQSSRLFTTTPRGTWELERTTGSATLHDIFDPLYIEYPKGYDDTKHPDFLCGAQCMAAAGLLEYIMEYISPNQSNALRSALRKQTNTSIHRALDIATILQQLDATQWFFWDALLSSDIPFPLSFVMYRQVEEPEQSILFHVGDANVCTITPKAPMQMVSFAIPYRQLTLHRYRTLRRATIFSHLPMCIVDLVVSYA